MADLYLARKAARAQIRKAYTGAYLDGRDLPAAIRSVEKWETAAAVAADDDDYLAAGAAKSWLLKASAEESAERRSASVACAVIFSRSGSYPSEAGRNDSDMRAAAEPVR